MGKETNKKIWARSLLSTSVALALIGFTLVNCEQKTVSHKYYDEVQTFVSNEMTGGNSFVVTVVTDHHSESLDASVELKIKDVNEWFEETGILCPDWDHMFVDLEIERENMRSREIVNESRLRFRYGEPYTPVSIKEEFKLLALEVHEMRIKVSCVELKPGSLGIKESIDTPFSNTFAEFNRLYRINVKPN